MPTDPTHDPHGFARSWIDAWNAHDLDAVLAHFCEDFEFSSPNIVRVTGEASGRLRGKAAVRAYWSAALARLPDLRFELVDVLAGVDGLLILYRGHRGLSAEVFEFDANGQVRRGQALYAG
ncbi:nuclear transport factor 2 family protein [Thermithiobacillus plumbiphilus]|jgi:ketosteroid isomerase-like protein|uniref:Nuclear transport factor 2 family protein n=1 Tax=Thermithiobacillus plumbiphilus TaxID=1729899 RepID=A0ABU9D6U3_9PROT